MLHLWWFFFADQLQHNSVSRPFWSTLIHTKAKAMRKGPFWPLALSPPNCKENTFCSCWASDHGKNKDPLNLQKRLNMDLPGRNPSSCKGKIPSAGRFWVCIQVSTVRSEAAQRLTILLILQCHLLRHIFYHSLFHCRANAIWFWILENSTLYLTIYRGR